MNNDVVIKQGKELPFQMHSFKQTACYQTLILNDHCPSPSY